MEQLAVLSRTVRALADAGSGECLRGPVRPDVELGKPHLGLDQLGNSTESITWMTPLD
jgi:hypothetical protein